MNKQAIRKYFFCHSFSWLVLVALLFLLPARPAYSQKGSLLLIGGGTERSGTDSWNGQAFQWAVDQSENRQVAFLTFYQSSATSWLPDHFISDWGAERARNFVISSREDADAQSTYDSLMNYDVIYIKGGDQANYYETYNDTKVEQAVQDKFSRGGVICGTSAGLAILGEVDFTAVNGTVYPDECLRNWDNQYITLADDFLPGLFEGVLFDTHFVQRGRFARMLAFMANWQFHQGQQLTGIGVDDLTALAVNNEGEGQVYGTGCANVYRYHPETPFEQDGMGFSVDSLRVHQLLQGCEIDFSNYQISGFSGDVQPHRRQESKPYHLMLSGSNPVDENRGLIRQLVHQTGSVEDSIIIFTGSDPSLAEEYRSALYAEDVENVMIYTAGQQAADDDLLADRIQQCHKFLFVGNNPGPLRSFFRSGNTGQVLRQRMAHSGSVGVFIGDNSRMAGRIIVQGYQEPQASYQGTMDYHPGLSLMETTVVMPNTFLNQDMYENTAAGVPYTMIRDSLAYGVWLSRNSFLDYRPVGDKIQVVSYGEHPAMILRSRGTDAGLASQTSKGDGTQQARHVVGFRQMNLAVLKPGEPYVMGVADYSQLPTRQSSGKLTSSQPLLYHNGEGVLVRWPGNHFSIRLIDMTGKVRFVKQDIEERYVINSNRLSPGIYVAWLRSHPGGATSKMKVVIH